MDEKAIARFWSKVDKNGPVVRAELGPCHIWCGYRKPDTGYGLAWTGERTTTAHRFSLEQKLGRALLDGMETCHSCDIRACVNQSHLFEGTKHTNQRDSVSKGRRRHLRGDRGPRSILTAAIVLDLRRRHQLGETHRALASELGVSEATVCHAISGRNWAHI